MTTAPQPVLLSAGSGAHGGHGGCGPVFVGQDTALRLAVCVEEDPSVV